MLLHLLEPFHVEPFWSIGSGTLAEVPARLRELGGDRAILIADSNTMPAAGEAAAARLEAAGCAVDRVILPAGEAHADDRALKRLLERARDVITERSVVLAVGSGTLNDLGKAVAAEFARPMIILGTAPSMDGFASGTSSLTINRVKTSVKTHTPDYIILDTDILSAAPLPLLWAGLGDMLAKYSSLCDWRISHIVNGEAYDPAIAALVRAAVQACGDRVEMLPKRDPAAVAAVAEGLILAGMAMTLAGVSRPASGVEHYISHFWDMRAAAFDISADYHGLQCGVASMAVAPLYRDLRALLDTYELPEDYRPKFDREAWRRELSDLLGVGAEPLIELDDREQKYLPAEMAERARTALRRRGELQEVITAAMAGSETFIARWRQAGGPTTLAELSVTRPRLGEVFRHTGDVRDKYVLSRLLLDLGLADNIVTRGDCLRLVI